MQVDWRAYRKEFFRTHGGQPVIHGRDQETGRGGHWLFRDGWRYGLSAGGPEMAPRDEEEQCKLIRAYWTVRKRITQAELYKLKSDIEDLMKLQGGRTTPVQINSASRAMLVRTIRNTLNPKPPDGLVTANKPLLQEGEGPIEPVDFDLLLSLAEEMRGYIRECDEQLIRIEIPERPVYHFDQGAVLERLLGLDRETIDAQSQ